MKEDPLEASRALWNRSHLVLESDEVLAQLLDRGRMKEWRALYRLARTNPELRSRIKKIVSTIPVALPHFWLAALANLGDPVDWNAPLPDYFDATAV